MPKQDEPEHVNDDAEDAEAVKRQAAELAVKEAEAARERIQAEIDATREELKAIEGKMDEQYRTDFHWAAVNYNKAVGIGETNPSLTGHYLSQYSRLQGLLPEAHRDGDLREYANLLARLAKLRARL